MQLEVHQKLEILSQVSGIKYQQHSWYNSSLKFPLAKLSKGSLQGSRFLVAEESVSRKMVKLRCPSKVFFKNHVVLLLHVVTNLFM